MTENHINSASYCRNNLDLSSSPYLLQHSENPVWWQEWNSEVTDLALQENKPMLVSVGYSSCHWCHVMAAEAFSDLETARYLNENYICIKIDREQRPDIDQYMMHFMQAQSGSGGWPLNVFLTPDGRPVLAVTYAPVQSEGGRMSFREIAMRVREYLKSGTDRIQPFEAIENEPPPVEESALTADIATYWDENYGGFGTGQKFPPHSILLFLLYHLSIKDDETVRRIVTSTLESIMKGGLNDHLQGGIFRYCVDRKWTIPHFEKMLYDQALSLWTFSLAYKVTGNRDYRAMSEKILKCLNECFEHNGLYVTAFNADTDHHEGATYLWTREEIPHLLGDDDFKRFTETYEISDEGNFEGKNHLIRKNYIPLNDLEEKLLETRKKRSQPSVDHKILSGLNALAAIAMIQAGRFLDRPDLGEKAENLFKRILEAFWDGHSLGHSFFNGILQKQSFLSDAAAVLTAATMLFETNEEWMEPMDRLAVYVESFREDGVWIESGVKDFRAIRASWTDQPVPSGVSLAETGLTRYAILTGREITPLPYRRVLQSDFYNINALLSNDLFHVYTTLTPLSWNRIPANSLQKRGEPETDCFNKVCRILSSDA
jgi:uncharacterized protein YyaL (SSP411 family)